MLPTNANDPRFHLIVATVMCVAASIVLGLLPPASGGVVAQEKEPSALNVARALVESFSEHDAEAMAALVTSDFELYYFGEDGMASLSTQGRDQLRAEMSSYFASRPTVRSTIVGVIDGPVFVSFREQIVGGQSSLAVYEVRQGLIRRVWYYPAED
jgi:hypothetical protein